MKAKVLFAKVFYDVKAIFYLSEPVGVQKTRYSQKTFILNLLKRYRAFQKSTLSIKFNSSKFLEYLMKIT